MGASLTPDRLAELCRIAAETKPGTNERRVIETALALLDRIERLEADNYNLDSENYELYRRIERLEAKLARQRVALRRLQAAVERRNSQERIEALWYKLSDEKRLLDRIEALEAMLLHLYQDTVVPGTGYCNRCGMTGGHDEWCAMAAVEKLLGIEVKGDGEEEGGASDA